MKNKSRIQPLTGEEPRLYRPKLAKLIGLNETIVLHQIHFFISLEGAPERGGRKWVYKTIEAWQEQFQFWSLKTVERALKGLRDRKLIFVANFNKTKYDRTLWYSINYARLDKMSPSITTNSRNGNQPIGEQDSDSLGQPIPEKTKEMTNERGMREAHTPSLKRYTSISDITKDDIREIAEKRGVSVGKVKFTLEVLKSDCEAKDKEYKNYKAALSKYVLNAEKWAREEREARGFEEDGGENEA